LSNNHSGNNNQQLFDIVQRKFDGVWLVWTRKSPLDLGLIVREEIEAARGQAFTEEEWANYQTQSHVSDPSIPIIAATFQQRPTVDTVLALLGVKRRPRPEGAKGFPAKGQGAQNRRPRPEVAKAA
jgi:hypothetical protein